MKCARESMQGRVDFGWMELGEALIHQEAGEVTAGLELHTVQAQRPKPSPLASLPPPPASPAKYAKSGRD